MKALKGIYPVFIMWIFLLLAWSPALAGSSDSFSIPTSVLSGGGGEASSESFIMNTTMGQPGPLPAPSGFSSSETYDLYPGFWYTLEAGPVCGDLGTFAATFGLLSGDPGYSPGCDFDEDGDVDGEDLAEFMEGL